MAVGLPRRDSIRSPSDDLSSVSTERGRSWFYAIRFDQMAFGLVGGLMIKREMVEYANMEMYARWRKGVMFAEAINPSCTVPMTNRV